MVRTKNAPVKPQISTRPPTTRAMTPIEDMERVFENLLPKSWARSVWDPTFARGQLFDGRVPAVDVIDRDEEIIVRAELPGVDKDDLEISMTDNIVTLKGRTKPDVDEEEGDFFRCEIVRGGFSRNVVLPGEVNSNKARATLKDGMLELVIPKAERAKRQTIAIK